MRYVIIGNSATGVSAAWTIRRRDPVSGIEIISDEGHHLYSRILLVYWIAGRVSRNDLSLQSPEEYETRNIVLSLNERVEEIDAKAHRLSTTRRTGVPYDRLLIATGASAIRPEIPGIELEGVETLRVVEDAERIISGAIAHSPVVVIGGGLIGVRASEALVARGVRVHMVVSSSHILSQMLDPQSSEIILQRLQEHGVEVRLGTDVKEFFGRGRLEGLLLSDGSRIHTGLAVVGKGVRPNTACVLGTGAEVDLGVCVDEHMATAAPDIYAAGDVAEAYDSLRDGRWINALWPIAVEQGRAAGINMTGCAEVYAGTIRLNSMEVFGLPCVSIGHVYDSGDARTLLHNDRHLGIYRKLFLRDDRLVGAVLIGDVRGAGVLTGLIRSPRPFANAWIHEILTRGPLFSLQMLGNKEAA
ncbi:MAG: NAD(P)/FAD-dependent oxidoreductase [Deltaproteobacteria bacterium]|nr:NAD(P)/FAD-dependent oxidoreductase [Deltaproteobacteria bacterium]